VSTVESTVESIETGAGSGWLADAVAQAHALGLRVALSVEQGATDPTGTLAAAVEWSRRTRSASAASGVQLAERLPTGKVLDLAFPAPSPASGTGDTPAAPIEHSTVAPEATAPAPRAQRATPSADLEGTVLAVFRSLLGPEVDATTAFFTLGATSLTLVLAHRQLAAQGFDTLTVVDLFAHPSVRELAAHLGERAAPPVSTAPVSTPPAATDPPPGRRAARLRAEQVSR
jgi:pyochelin synthetase